MSTKNYARIGVNNVVIENWQPPEELAYLKPSDIFVPCLAVEFKPCPDGVKSLWVFSPIDSTYSPPAQE
jgi:hypothetical protein